MHELTKLQPSTWNKLHEVAGAFMGGVGGSLKLFLSPGLTDLAVFFGS